MSLDKQKLKSMACEALNHPLDPIRGMAFQSTVRPHVMLALLEEIEIDAMHMRAFGEAMRSQDEQIDQLKSENEKMRSFLSEVSRTSGDKWAVMAARNLLKEFGHD